MAPVQFGNYQILRKIGAGGMAQVFEAQRVGAEGFSRRVALKCILPEMTRDHRFVEMFVNEARLGSQLHHPNIVEIQDFNKINDVYYIAMEFVEGIDLGEVISRFRDEEREFPPGLAVDIILQALEGLGYAHEATTDDGEAMTIIHRDIKPSNLLLTRRGTVKIADFGIAKAATNAYQTRTSEVTKGSLAYMAPEQITREAPISPASDLFAIGAVLFEMLSLRALFDGENMPSIMFKVAQVEIERDLSEFAEHYPELVPVLRRALARDVNDRYRAASEMAADLRPLRSRYGSTLNIAELVAEFSKPHPVEEEEGVGEQTASLLGWNANALMAPNLAAYNQTVQGMPGGMGGMGAGAGQGMVGPGVLPTGAPPPPPPHIGSNPMFNSTMYLPRTSLPGVENVQDSQPSLAITPPVKRRSGVLTALVALLLVVLVGGGLFASRGMFVQPATAMIISSPPGALIALNGRPLTQKVNGRVQTLLTPAKVELPEEGAAQIALDLTGYERYLTQITYEPGSEHKVEASLKPEAQGALEISSTPTGASIELNGRQLQQKTPFRIDNLPGGTRYDVKLSLDGYSSTSHSVEVPTKGTFNLAATLVPAPVVVAKPTPAPVAAADRPVSRPAPETGSGQPGEPAATPKPAAATAGPPGTLVVSAVPPDVVVYVDGVKRGNAPATIKLPPGSHKVRLERFDGSVAKEFTAQVVSNSETTKVWDLDGKQFISE